MADLKGIIKYVLMVFTVFVLSLLLNYLFFSLDEKNIMKIGSFVHIGLLGVLVFLPFVFLNKKGISEKECILILLLFSIISYSPLIYMKNSSVLLVEIFVYVSFIIYISCKNLKRKGVKWKKKLKIK